MVVLAAGTAAAVHLTHDEGPAPAAAAATLPTALVRRADLSTAVEVDGTLGYAGAYTVLGRGSGTVTWLPAAGTVVTRGRPVYRADGRPVPLFYGTPFWRTLEPGMTGGADVLQLERNLVALGHGAGLTVDRTFTAATRSAIRRWQKATGLPRTGTVAPGDVVTMPGPIRVTGSTSLPGGPASGTVLTASGTTRQVTAGLPVASQHIAAPGAAVRIELPAGRTVTGRIASVGTVAVADPADARSQTGLGTESATITVTITLDRAADAGTLDSAPVTVAFTSAAHPGVLAVPVHALLAAADGSYAVSVVGDDGTVTAVRVELGIFDGDRVEVRGDLTEGTRVQVPIS
ncbi:peptidoglycan-binding protein [Actinoplanes italicus]|nr:peptidoglycan-binding protein [Actinoplanes italicus]